MSGICRGPNGLKTIQFSEKEMEGRPKIHLGKASLEVAKGVQIKLQALLAAKKTGLPIDNETAAWIGRIGADLHDRLVQLGLAQSRGGRSASATLSGILNDYIAKRSRLKPNTLRNYRTTQRLLEDHFGGKRLVESIHAGHARDYREWLVGKYATATVAREIKRARQFFEYAKDCRLITDNPFAKVRAGAQTNQSRKFFVTKEVVDRLMEALPDNDHRLALALVRYGGFRPPSEFKGLTWDCVDWAKQKILIRVPKKEHLDGHETRFIPIFAGIRPYIERAFEDAPDGAVHVVSKRFHEDGVFYAALRRCARRIGIKFWPKLLVNLRASRETELEKAHPSYKVKAWMGNTQKVAEDHYLMLTDADYVDAAEEPVQKTVLPAAVTNGQQPSTEKESAVSPAFARDTADKVPPRGVEPRFSG
jgi:integrase